jgi:hypothetical protein
MAGTEELFNEGTDSWENVLEALLAFVGQEVAIGVMGEEDARPIAHIEGTFSTAYEMPASGKTSISLSEDDDAFKITVMRGDEIAGSFAITRDNFKYARRSTPGGVLELKTPPVIIYIQPL